MGRRREERLSNNGKPMPLPTRAHALERADGCTAAAAELGRKKKRERFSSDLALYKLHTHTHIHTHTHTRTHASEEAAATLCNSARTHARTHAHTHAQTHTHTHTLTR